MRPTRLSFAVLTVWLFGCGISAVEIDEAPDHAGSTGRETTRLPGAPDAGTPEVPEVPQVPDAGSSGCESGAEEACTTSCDSGGARRCIQTVWSACQPPVEKCGNGVDDDCDGKVDLTDADCPPPRRKCEDSEGGGCNGDLGYGNRCAPADNENGCSADRFHAWCNRRNPELPNIWDNWIENWVDSRCDGQTSLSGATFMCLSSNNELFECTTPLVLVFEPSRRVEFLPPRERFAFSAGRPVVSDWPSSATPWLVRDLDRNGAIDTGAELFGSNTSLPGGARAKHGFEALAALDANADGSIDAKDPAFASLGVWRDDNANRRVEPGELTSLKQEGVETLSTRFALRVECNPRGDCERERAAFTGARSGELVDVYLRVEAPASWRASAKTQPPVLACR